MSLAQKIERPPVLSPELSLGMTRVASPVDIRDLTRRTTAASSLAVLKSEPAAAASVSPAARKEADTAFDLLNEVSKVVPQLLARCERLEGALSESKEQVRGEIEAANDVAREWQQIANALKLQVEGLEKGMKAMKQRADAAEEQVAMLRDMSDKSQHAAAEAECLSSLFREKVISTFGVGSPIHPILETSRKTA